MPEDYLITGVMSRTPSRTQELADLLGCGAHNDIGSLLASRPDFVVEFASVEAVHQYAEDILSIGANIVVASVGAFADEDFKKRILNVARQTRSKIYIPSGAIGGFDLMKTFALMGNAEVTVDEYFSDKGLQGAPYLKDHPADMSREGLVFSGSPSEAMAAHKMGAEGIGLFRSEFLFIGRDDLPTEAEQFEAYSSVARLFGEKKGPVVIRTLDIGADKILPSLSFGEEDNPALGMRGIRLCLAKPEVFRTQLRAILRASAFGKVAIMLPMVTNIDEVRQTRRILSEEKNRLRFEEVDFDENIGLGIMIETPAAAIMAEKLAGECDFFSVGTNDLFQYTMAADRQNHHLSYLAEGDGIEPVLRLIKLASDGIHAAGGDKWIGICGEMAADESLTELLISSGIDELSVSPPYIARVKERIRSID